MDIIVYHNSCPDGFTAAYIAKLRYPEAKLFPRDHGLEPPYEELAGKDVLVVDFSWRTREQNDRIAAAAKSFRILDHHKTAQEVLAGAPYAVFDLNRSGAGLAWDYLFGEDSVIKLPIFVNDIPTGEFLESESEPRPWYVDYVEDRDLWRFRLPESEAVNAYIMTFPYEIVAWDQMAKTSLATAIQIGQSVQLEINKYIREVLKQTQAGNLNVLGKSYTVGVVNVPYLHTSDIGNALAHRYDIGLGWFERADSVIQFSARSLGDIDVSAIAKTFGGGGHKNAAGWQLPLGEGRRIVDIILGRQITQEKVNEILDRVGKDMLDKISRS